MEKDPPPASEISSTTPPELERLIARCLRKDVNRRSQNMADVKLALEELRDESESGKLARPAAAARRGSAPLGMAGGGGRMRADRRGRFHLDLFQLSRNSVERPGSGASVAR